MKKLVNISGIPFETGNPKFNTCDIRNLSKTPTDFGQEKLTNLYGDVIKNAKKVLEIGCGAGRNAQYFLNTDIQYFGFDPSPTAMDLFRNNRYWGIENQEQFYISLEIDETILSQEYDMIFSTYVLQHVGFSTDEDVYDSVSITKALFPTLKSGGIWLAYELYQGQNDWSPKRWKQESFEADEVKVLYHEPASLEGCEPTIHDLIVIKKEGKQNV